MPKPPSVLLLYNEPVLPADHPDAGSEHDILETADDTFRVLKDAGFATTKLGVNYDPQPLLDFLREKKPDAVFNLFEGIATQTGTEVSAAALLEWLNNGAYLYICGAKEPMCKDVEDTFVELFKAKGKSEEEARNYLVQLEEEGRYSKDVY